MDYSSKLKLYKQILYHAKRFPSVKRAKVLEEIKAEWKYNKKLTDPIAIRKRLAVAIDGLGKLKMYTSLKPDAMDWQITLDQNPIPKKDDEFWFGKDNFPSF